jgi:hypothetical protein
MAHYSRNPYWITARFSSHCTCGADIRRGDRAFYYPSTKATLCSKDTCGKQAERDLAADDFDAAVYASQY